MRIKEQSKKLGVGLSTQKKFSEIIKHRDASIRWAAQFAREQLKQAGVPLLKGEAQIRDRYTVQIDDGLIKGKNIIIATGSAPNIPPMFKTGKNILTSKELTQINKLPKKLVIIGGGVIGAEFATIFHYLGSKVTVIEMTNRLLPNEDASIGEHLLAAYRKAGITINLNAAITKITPSKLVTPKHNIGYDKVLVAIGRHPILDEKLFGKLSIKKDRSGIATNLRMQTNIKNIYAIGDATGRSILAHVGIRQAQVAAHSIMKIRDRMKYHAIPRCVYSFPEIACVGRLGVGEKNVCNGIVPINAVTRAVIEAEPEGFIKATLKNGRVIGIHMIGQGVTELINQATIIIERKMRAKDILRTIHAHPTLGEGIRDAVRVANTTPRT